MTKKANNPMKPAEPTVVEGPIFESEDLAALAAEAAKEYKFELGDLVGTGADGVITLDDIQTIIDQKAAEVSAGNNTPDDKEKAEVTDVDEIFASDQAKDLAVQLNNDGVLATAAIAEIKGSGTDGRITTGDIRKAVKAIEKEKADAEQAEADKAKAAADAEKAAADAEKQDENEEEEDTDLNNPKHVAKLNAEVIEELLSFSAPVRGSLNTKPRVQESWNVLVKKAVKLRKAIAHLQKRG